MELDVFAGQEKSELSMIEVARAILETRGRDNEMYFNDLVNEIQNYLEKSDADIRKALPFFYSDLNTDGSFIPLGDNKWGLRSWYAIDEIDEEVITLEDTDENAPKRKNKKVNAFMDGDEDAIDYNDDDPEDPGGACGPRPCGGGAAHQRQAGYGAGQRHYLAGRDPRV